MSQGHGEAQHAAPWESIVEEGFQATLAGSDNGRAFGSGVYFARDAALSHKYALASASRRECPSSAKSSVKPLRMFLSRIVTGVYTGALCARGAHTCSASTCSASTCCIDLLCIDLLCGAVGNPSMKIPPLDPSGAKGEHFHSLVDNMSSPRIYVVNDNTRAFPGSSPAFVRCVRSLCAKTAVTQGISSRTRTVPKLQRRCSQGRGSCRPRRQAGASPEFMRLCCAQDKRRWEPSRPQPPRPQPPREALLLSYRCRRSSRSYKKLSACRVLLHILSEPSHVEHLNRKFHSCWEPLDSLPKKINIASSKSVFSSTMMPSMVTKYSSARGGFVRSMGSSTRLRT